MSADIVAATANVTSYASGTSFNVAVPAIAADHTGMMVIQWRGTGTLSTPPAGYTHLFTDAWVDGDNNIAVYYRKNTTGVTIGATTINVVVSGSAIDSFGTEVWTSDGDVDQYVSGDNTEAGYQTTCEIPEIIPSDGDGYVVEIAHSNFYRKFQPPSGTTQLDYSYGSEGSTANFAAAIGYRKLTAHVGGTGIRSWTYGDQDIASPFTPLASMGRRFQVSFKTKAITGGTGPVGTITSVTANTPTNDAIRVAGTIDTAIATTGSIYLVPTTAGASAVGPVALVRDTTNWTADFDAEIPAGIYTPRMVSGGQTINNTGITVEVVAFSGAVAVPQTGDTTAPTGSITVSPSTLTNASGAGTVQLNVTAADPSGIFSVEFFKNGSTLGTVFAEPYQLSDTVSVPAGGTVSYTAVITDDADNTRTTSAAVLTVNITTPVENVTVTASGSASSITAAGALVLNAAISGAQASSIVALQWRRNAENLGDEIPVPGPYTQLVQLTAADNGTQLFDAIARTASGTTFLSNPITVVVNIPTEGTRPAAPSALTVVTRAQTTLALSWKDNATDEVAFVLEVSENNGQFIEQPLVAAAASSGSTVTHTVTGLKQGTPYRLRVKARGQLDSGYSAIVSTSTLPSTSSGRLASVTASATSVSGQPGTVGVITYTVQDENGAAIQGVNVLPIVSNTAVATVSPGAATTDANGRATFSVSLVAVGDVDLTVVASTATETLPASSNPTVDLVVLPTVSSVLLRSIKSTQRDSKYNEEVVPYAVDFSRFLSRGETVSSVTSTTIDPVRGADADPDADDMLVGSTQLSGAIAVQFVRAGVAGEAYLLRVTVLTSIGARYTDELRIAVHAAEGARAAGSNPVI